MSGVSRERVRIAVVQADAVRARTDVNLERAARFVGDAARRGVSLVVFPEMYLTGYEVWDQLPALALPSRCGVLDALADEARRHRVAVMIGYPERSRGALYNAVCVIDADGRAHAPYRKIHLFGREREHFRPGRRYWLGRVGGLVVGVLICYDLEFPESARALALAGAELVAVSTANMSPFREAQEVYVRARALENQLFVALANRVGAEGRTRFVGGSGVWDPSGGTLVQQDGGEAVLVATIDRRALRRARGPFNYLRERRPECYAALTRRHRRRG